MHVSVVTFIKHTWYKYKRMQEEWIIIIWRHPKSLSWTKPEHPHTIWHTKHPSIKHIINISLTMNHISYVTIQVSLLTVYLRKVYSVIRSDTGPQMHWFSSYYTANTYTVWDLYMVTMLYGVIGSFEERIKWSFFHSHVHIIVSHTCTTHGASYPTWRLVPCMPGGVSSHGLLIMPHGASYHCMHYGTSCHIRLMVHHAIYASWCIMPCAPHIT